MEELGFCQLFQLSDETAISAQRFRLSVQTATALPLCSSILLLKAKGIAQLLEPTRVSKQHASLACLSEHILRHKMIFTSNANAFVIVVACFCSLQVKPAASHACHGKVPFAHCSQCLLTPDLLQTEE